MQPKLGFSKGRKRKRHISGWDAVDRKGGVLWMQRRKSLGYNNFLIDTSMCTYISTDLSLSHIVPGCLWSLSLANKYQAKDAIVLVKLHLILKTWYYRGSAPPILMTENCWNTQSQDFFGALCPFENHVTLTGLLPATSHHLSFLCSFASTLHFYFLSLAFDSTFSCHV